MYQVCTIKGIKPALFSPLPFYPVQACRHVFLERRRPYDLKAMRARGTPPEFFQQPIGETFAEQGVAPVRMLLLLLLCSVLPMLTLYDAATANSNNYVASIIRPDSNTGESPYHPTSCFVFEGTPSSEVDTSTRCKGEDRSSTATSRKAGNKPFPAGESYMGQKRATKGGHRDHVSPNFGGSIGTARPTRGGRAGPDPVTGRYAIFLCTKFYLVETLLLNGSSLRDRLGREACLGVESVRPAMLSVGYHS